MKDQEASKIAQQCVEELAVFIVVQNVETTGVQHQEFHQCHRQPHRADDLNPRIQMSK